MTSTVFVNGTVVQPQWLNDVNTFVYKDHTNIITGGAVGNGTADDTAAIQSVFTALSVTGGTVVIPSGFTFKITSYIQVFSNTTVVILGTVQLTGRNSGFYCLNASNVSFYGNGIGKFTDTTVAANYTWNIGTPVAPCIHIRSSVNCIVDGIVGNFVSAGLYHSNATTNANTGSGFTLTGTVCSNITFSNNYFTMVEMGSISGYTSTEVTYSGNYVYRSGDGGIWMMGCLRSRAINNSRVSPATTAVDVTAHGANNSAFPTTWNDLQGMEFENCHSLLVEGNSVFNFAQLPIDIKNNCSEIEVVNNMIYYPESSGIVVREGDTVKNACHRVSIRGNQIFNVGTSQLGSLLPTYQGAIVAAESYLIDISDNLIHSWSQVPAIVALGPEGYLASQYPSNPVQAAIAIQNNRCWFKGTFQENIPAQAMTSSTPASIVVSGFYDSVAISGNLIKGDRFFASDSRSNTNPAILLAYSFANSLFYPATANITCNVISNWIGQGITISGQSTQQNSGCVINGNSISGVTASGIQGNAANGLIVSNNNVSNVGTGAGFPAIFLNAGAGSSVVGAQVSGNLIFGREVGGTNTMTYGIVIDKGSNCNVTNNNIRSAATATVNFTNQVGEIKITLTDGFPRTGAASPAGSLFPLFIGEQYYATSAGKWWQASAIATTAAWTQLSN